MAKKLVYNYTFTPGAANVGNVVISGNYPAKVWQLVTDTGTGGLYPHTFVRDEYATSSAGIYSAATGAIEIISGGSGDLAASGSTTFNENTGVLTVVTSTVHGLSTGATVKFRELGLVFTCAKDDYATEHLYPRTTDPVYDTALSITVTDTTTFTVDVGRTVGGKISSNNEIIYNFADSAKGGSTYYNSVSNETKLTFKHDTSHLDSRDELQIFIDIQEDKVNFSETFTDPVSKLRVSNPQNLIDTDFEYGLQPTKWETVELVNNIPSFFASSSDYSLSDVVSVTTIAGTEQITVITQTEHGLTVGSPIDVQGLSSRTAEGKYLVTSVPNTTTFIYESKDVQANSGVISGDYTVITPGEFYAGSNITIDNEKGIETDGANPSVLTMNTDYHHGFEAGSSLYFTNTVGSKILTLDQTSNANAPDSSIYVDPVNTLNTTLSVTESLTETKQMKGTYSHKFTSADVNTSGNTITWPNHSLQAGDALLYIPSSGDTHIGGLERFQIYYVKSAPTANTITLCETTNGDYDNNSTISLTSTGTSNYGRHQLALVYEIGRLYSGRYSSFTYVYTRRSTSGAGSGRDMSTNMTVNGQTGYFGLLGKKPDKMLLSAKGYFSPSSYAWYSAFYTTRWNANFTFGKSGTTPDGYDPVEDFKRFEISSIGRNDQYHAQYYFRYNYAGYYSRSITGNNVPSAGTVFMIPLDTDPEADTLYVPNHGIEPGSSVTVTRNSGSDIVTRTDTGNLYYQTPTTSTFTTGSSSGVEIVDTNRIRLSSAARIQSAAGDYTITANVTNPTKNSFYVNAHSLIDGQKLTLSTTGTLPTTDSGVSSPTLSSTLKTIYNSVKSSLDSIRTTMGEDAGQLLYNGSSHEQPITGNSVFFDGGYQLFYIRRYEYYVNRYNASGNSLGAVVGRFNTNSSFATGEVWDPFSSTSLAGQGWYHICTPFSQNSTTPYHIDITQVPDLASLSVGSAIAYLQRNSYNYRTDGVPTNNDNNYSNWTSLADGWRYTYDANYFVPDGTYHGHLCYAMIIDNTGWPGYYQNYSTNNSWWSRSLQMEHQGRGGQRYHVQFILPIRDTVTSSRYGAAGTILTHSSIMNTIANGIKNSLTKPTLSAGEVYANVINGNRFSLKNSDGVEYDLTNSGTSPFSFQTEELTGGLDGYYDVDVTQNSKITTFADTVVPKRTLAVGNTEVVELNNVVYINKDNHKVNTTQKLVYTEDGGNISGLTNGSTYYAIVSGPNHLQLATSAVDASLGSAIGIGTTGAGSFTFEVPSISGRSEAQGTIGITSTSTKIEGTDTLFKRFFRTGDKFIISDSTISPPSFREFQVSSVIDDTELTITEIPGVTLGSTKYFVDTKINVRPDGAFLHRPFDGGVEIDAGTSPNSSIVRQTRKYFRYQSGKGIQCSVAVNFNPSRVANTLTSIASTTLPVENYFVNLNNNETFSYIVSGSDRDGVQKGENEELTVMKGDTLNLQINAPNHPVWIKTAASTGTGDAVTTGISANGITSGSIVWDTTNVGVGTYYYQCENHGVMGGVINVESVPNPTDIATLTTRYPHGLTRNNDVTVRGSSDLAYNGTFKVEASTDFTLRYYLTSTPGSSSADGIIEYNIDSWTNSAVRCGLFDYQNGMFYEFDGTTLYAVRRSSVQQLPGSVRVQTGENKVFGTDTNFSGQLQIGDYVVIRGQSYRVTNVPSKTEIHIQPSYRGTDSADAIITKTVDTKVAQENWNIDKADGTGPSGFVLDMTKIQMAYIDYSWYGAGKIRFGFKDANGHVKYMHEFVHNNIIEEAYMRSGNIPGRYEIENYGGLPSYVPSLFHWGTSVIMDGKFDDDKAYLFTAASNSLVFTNGDSNSATSNANSSLIYKWNSSNREYDFYVRIPFDTADSNKFSSGAPLYTADDALTGELIDYVDYSGSNVRVHIYIGSNRRYWNTPAVYPSVTSGTVVSVGAPASGGDEVDLLNEVPLISIRLAPSVDNNLTGALGQRDIINRMQLQLKQFGITLSHDCNVDLILNGNSSNLNYENVASPSLSELVKHQAGDRIVGGTKIFSLRASGGTENAAGKRLSATSDFDISQITDLGNSILGGDGTFPNGPDVLTIAIKPIDTSEINADTPLSVSSRITWTESQA